MIRNEIVRIENARLYPPTVVDRLRTALLKGADLHADESRRNFYDLSIQNRTYFIYVSPINGNITLIATWAQKRPSAASKTDEHAHWWRWIRAHLLAA
jgi:hypothetical protein